MELFKHFIYRDITSVQSGLLYPDCKWGTSVWDVLHRPTHILGLCCSTVPLTCNSLHCGDRMESTGDYTA